MAKQDEYIRITTRIPPEVHDALVASAIRTERSLNGELVARLQIALALSDAESRPRVLKQKTVDYNDPVKLLMEIINDMPEEKQRALLLLLK